MAVFSDGNSDSHNDSWTTTDIKSNGKNEAESIFYQQSCGKFQFYLELKLIFVECGLPRLGVQTARDGDKVSND